MNLSQISPSLVARSMVPIEEAKEAKGIIEAKELISNLIPNLKEGQKQNLYLLVNYLTVGLMEKFSASCDAIITNEGIKNYMFKSVFNLAEVNEIEVFAIAKYLKQICSQQDSLFLDPIGYTNEAKEIIVALDKPTDNGRLITGIENYLTSRLQDDSQIDSQIKSIMLQVRGNLPGLNFQGANLQGANFSGLDLSYANFSGANLKNVQFSATKLIGANLVGANLTGANLTGAKLFKADFTKANLSQANLEKVQLSKGILTGATLVEVNLSEAVLDFACLFGANLSGANLTNAKLDGALLIEANLINANVEGVNLEQANLKKAKFE